MGYNSKSYSDLIIDIASETMNDLKKENEKQIRELKNENEKLIEENKRLKDLFKSSKIYNSYNLYEKTKVLKDEIKESLIHDNELLEITCEIILIKYIFEKYNVSNDDELLLHFIYESHLVLKDIDRIFTLLSNERLGDKYVDRLNKYLNNKDIKLILQGLYGKRKILKLEEILNNYK